jgi:hypothetical protein
MNGTLQALDWGGGSLSRTLENERNAWQSYLEQIDRLGPKPRHRLPDTDLGYAALRVVTVYESTWRVDAGDGCLRVEAAGHDAGRSWGRLVGGTAGVPYVVTCSARCGTPSQREDQACIIVATADGRPTHAIR